VSIRTINPATGEVIADYPVMGASEVQERLDLAGRAYGGWSRATFAERGVILARVAELLRERSESLAVLITTEMGKPIEQARAEVEKCAWMFAYNAEHAEAALAPREVATEMTRSLVCFQPLGVVFAIMPWNFPLWQVTRFAAPNLMAGNAAVLSHAPISTGMALAIEGLFRDAGLPEGVFGTLLIEDAQASQVIADRNVAGVTLTGSEEAGRAVALEAARHLKKVVLELGGSDPYLILEDADLEHAAECCVNLRMLVSGQVCISPKRLIVVDAVHDAFETAVLERAAAFSVGDPLLDGTRLGPLARADLRDRVHAQVSRAVGQGATCLLGGAPVNGPGFFYPATVLKDIPPDSVAEREEIFGPVISIFRARDEKAAIEMANDSVYGLGAAVFTRDTHRGERLAREELQAGTCAVNTFVSSDPRLPFGGIKQSGFGRESGTEGIREFCNTKVVLVR